MYYSLIVHCIKYKIPAFYRKLEYCVFNRNSERYKSNIPKITRNIQMQSNLFWILER